MRRGRRPTDEQIALAVKKYGISYPYDAFSVRDAYLARIDEFVRSKALVSRLRSLGAHRVIDLVELDEDVLWKTKGFGATKIAALRWGLASMGMHFGMSPRHDWLFDDEVEH